MKTISIRELHSRTGYWVRMAHAEGPIGVTDRGRQVAVLGDASQFLEAAKPFPRRDRMQLPATDLDSSELLAEDRNR